MIMIISGRQIVSWVSFMLELLDIASAENESRTMLAGKSAYSKWSHPLPKQTQ